MTSASASLPATPATHAPATVFAIALAVGLSLTLALRVPGFVHHDTTEIVMWGHSGWAWGFWKHPPLLPWISRVWFMAVPMGAMGLAVLTALNIAIGAVAIWAIARIHARVPDERTALLAVILLAAVPYATVMAIKLNHNTVLISLWPLTILAFLRTLDRPGVMRGFAFGAIAACAVLAKYYSALLLAACVVAALATTDRARYWRSPAPYAAVFAFAVLIAPHGLWLVEQRASTLAYAFHADPENLASATRGPAMALMFAWQTPLLMLPMLIAACIIARAAGSTPRALVRASNRHRFERELLILTALPYLMTIAMTLVFHLRGATNWAMPVYLMLPVIAASRIGPPTARHIRIAAMTIAGLAFALCIAGQIGARVAVSRGVDGSTDPRQHVAVAVNAIWRQAIGQPLAVVAGDTRLSSAAVLYAPDHPQGWPSFSSLQAPWIDGRIIRASGFAALCRVSDAGCAKLAAEAAQGRGGACILRRRVELYGAAGPWSDVKLWIVPPIGHDRLQPIDGVVCKPE